MLYLVLLYFTIHLALYFTSDISYHYISLRVSADATRIKGDLNVESRRIPLQPIDVRICTLGNTWQVAKIKTFDFNERIL